ncbi:dihydrolipoamide dehydrogenase [Nonlabens xiamenensis]|uniref:dihydrolipoamide dehydrogenase n=1 Tax=Nonlabens xiamenensis TaxID=2341043 RepID=UPI000F60CDD0|nr:dihydrolipoamide dehydrogenase [Nonlabens xiamenensis]
MKKILFLFAAAATLISCEGPQGPAGFDGLDGLDGVNVVAQSFERTVDFDANYEALITYPPEVEVFPDDMTLVYILFDEVQGNNGGLVDVWRLLPQTLYSDFGEYQYNYDFTNGDVRLFVDGPATTDLTLLGSGDLDNQTFRVVILPVDLINAGVDVTDYNAVMSLGGLSEVDIIQLED